MDPYRGPIKRFNLELPYPEYEEARAFAKAQDVALTNLIRAALHAYIEANPIIVTPKGA